MHTILLINSDRITSFLKLTIAFQSKLVIIKNKTATALGFLQYDILLCKMKISTNGGLDFGFLFKWSLRSTGFRSIFLYFNKQNEN